MKYWNLARGGWSSLSASEVVFDMLTSGNITITATELIVLDFSVNDGISFHGSNVQSLFQRIYEHLVRSIVSTYLRFGFRPTIIIVEQYPTHRHNSNAYNYTAVYRPVARHYNATVWSQLDFHKPKLMDNPLMIEHLQIQALCCRVRSSSLACTFVLCRPLLFIVATETRHRSLSFIQ